MEPNLLDELLLHISSLSSIYHKSPQTFINNTKPRQLAVSPVLNKRHPGQQRKNNLFDADLNDLTSG